VTRLLVLLPLLALLALSAIFFVRLDNGDDPSRIPSALIGKQAPALTLAGLGETPGFGPGDLADGRVKIVNFWASWCAPCRIEHPIFASLKGKVDLYGVAYKDRTEEALGFLDEMGNPFGRIGMDSDGRAAIEWGVYGVPETYVVDGRGRIVWKHVGEVTAEALRKDILPAVERARAGG
jgi:cytochrome c biogenesis protein CcmG/thiol:disulfide interchange protein DsbE